MPKFRSSARLVLSIFTVNSFGEAEGGVVGSGLFAVTVASPSEAPVIVEDGGNVVLELSKEGPLDVVPADS